MYLVHVSVCDLSGVLHARESCVINVIEWKCYGVMPMLLWCKVPFVFFYLMLNIICFLAY